MATKKTSYIELELQWLESNLTLMKKQVDEILKNPVDRRGQKEVASGRLVENAIIIRAEDRMKIAMELMEKIAKILPAIDQMREKQEVSEARKGFDNKGNILTKPQDE